MHLYEVATSDLGVSTAMELCSPESGPRVVIVGGHHGDEPAGYAVAGLLSVYMRPRKGSFLIIPQANPGAVACHKRWDLHRGRSLDLNRCYSALPVGAIPPPEQANYKRISTPELQHAGQLLDSICGWSPDLVVDLHESYTPAGDRVPASDPGKGVLEWTVSCGARGKAVAPRSSPRPHQPAGIPHLGGGGSEWCRRHCNRDSQVSLELPGAGPETDGDPGSDPSTACGV